MKNKQKCNFISYGIISLAIFLMLVMPVISQAALVTCGVKDATVLATHPEYAKACDFDSFLTLINTIVTFILFNMAIPIAAIMFTYAGFLLVTAQGGEAKTKAKHIFTNAVLGLVFAAAAVIIVKTILTFLGYKDIGLFFR